MCVSAWLVVAVGCGGELSLRGTDAGDAGAVDAAAIDAGVDAAASDAGAGDASVRDAGVSDAGMADAMPPPSGRVVYTADRLVSPITDDVAAGLRAIAERAAAHEDRFSKIGDSITVSTSFLDCFDGRAFDLAGSAALEETRAFFAAADTGGGVTPFSRTSLCATVGWSASAALAGAPSPLTQELDAIGPRYAPLMYGTNDVGFRTPFAFAENMLDITDTLLERGVIPVLSSIPPRDDSAAADANVPLFDLLVRGIAQGRQVPFVDFHAALLPLAAHGLGPDHVHPNAYPGGACVLTTAGLAYGYDQRNLLVLTALDRARRARSGEPAPDTMVTRTRGDGRFASPFVIDALPFTDVRSTSLSGEMRAASYSCSTANEGGPELYYRVSVTAPTHVHAWLVDRGTVDVDLYLLDASGSPASCIVRNDREIQADLTPGDYTLVVESYVTSDGVAHPGEYLLVVM
jgi:hypothetical protein